MQLDEVKNFTVDRDRGGPRLQRQQGERAALPARLRLVETYRRSLKGLTTVRSPK
jgi:hypothetical protein